MTGPSKLLTFRRPCHVFQRMEIVHCKNFIHRYIKCLFCLPVSYETGSSKAVGAKISFQKVTDTKNRSHFTHLVIAKYDKQILHIQSMALLANSIKSKVYLNAIYCRKTYRKKQIKYHEVL